jgi:hypothetical protein
MRRLVIRWTRRWLAPAVACACSAVAIGSVALLQARADDSRDAQLKLAHVQTVLNHLQSDPFKANAHTGGLPEYARGLIDGDEATIEKTIHGLEDDGPAALGRLAAPLAATTRFSSGFTSSALRRRGMTSAQTGLRGSPTGSRERSSGSSVSRCAGTTARQRAH